MNGLSFRATIYSKVRHYIGDFIIIFIARSVSVCAPVCVYKEKDAYRVTGMHLTLLIVGKLLQVFPAVIR